MAKTYVIWGKINRKLFDAFELQKGLPFGRFEANPVPQFQETFHGTPRVANGFCWLDFPVSETCPKIALFWGFSTNKTGFKISLIHDHSSLVVHKLSPLQKWWKPVKTG